MVYQVTIIESDDEEVCIIPAPPKPPVLTINLDSDEDNGTKAQNNKKRKNQTEKDSREENSKSQKTKEKKKRRKKKPVEENLDHLFQPDIVLPTPPPPPPPKPKPKPISVTNNSKTNNVENDATNKKTLSSSSSSLPLANLSEADLHHFNFVQELSQIANMGLNRDEVLTVAQIDQTATKKTSQIKDNAQQQSLVCNSSSGNGNKSKSSTTKTTSSISSSKSTSSSSITGSKVVKDTFVNSSFKNADHHKNSSISSKDKESQSHIVNNQERTNGSVNNNGKSNDSEITSHKGLNHVQTSSLANANSTNVPVSKSTNSIAQASTATKSVTETVRKNSQKQLNTPTASSSSNSSALPTKKVQQTKSSGLTPCSSNIIFLCPKKVWNYDKCSSMLKYFQELEKELSIKIQRQINEAEGKGIIIVSGISFVGILSARGKISEWLEKHNLDQPNRGPLPKSSSTVTNSTTTDPSTSSNFSTSSNTSTTKATTTTSAATTLHKKKLTNSSTFPNKNTTLNSSRSEVGARRQNDKNPKSSLWSWSETTKLLIPTSKSVFSGPRKRKDFSSSLSSSSRNYNRVASSNNNNKKPVLEEVNLAIEDKLWYSDYEKISPLMASFRKIITNLDVLLEPKMENGHLTLSITSYLKNGHVFRAKRLLQNEIRYKCSNIMPPFQRPTPIFQHNSNNNNNYRTNEVTSYAPAVPVHNPYMPPNFNHTFVQPLPPPPPPVSFNNNTFNNNNIPSLWGPTAQQFTPPFFPSQWNVHHGFPNFY